MELQSSAHEVQRAIVEVRDLSQDLLNKNVDEIKKQLVGEFHARRWCRCRIC